ncbi:MAG TPA: saccharopine dehydrogenase C-terminal domain-containing protein [Acidimicrobiia bacterium]|nr:saccharopine dehydrogenase C-terminal domain-containing protein [Acidimicrobiia bacterium]
MRILVVGAGGVGSAIASIAAKRDFFESFAIADLDESRAGRAVAQAGADHRFQAHQVDASDGRALRRLVEDTHPDVIVNACDPRFNPPIFETAMATRRHYLDMAMHLSRPDPGAPFERPGVKLGDEEFAVSDRWVDAERLALVGMGADPGLSDVFARYASDHLFASIDEMGVRDGGDLSVDGVPFAPTFSIWTVIEECLNPPVVWERGRGWYTTAPFSEPEIFPFPEGIGPVECVNVEHEEVMLIPRWIDCRRVTFKYGLGREFIAALEMLHKIGLDRKDQVDVRGSHVAPRDLLAALLPDPARLGDRMHGKTCVGTWVTGSGRDGQPRELYLYHCVDNDEMMGKWGHQAVVWQTALNPVIALELLASGVWSGVGVLGPEAFPATPFLDLLVDYGSPWAIAEMNPASRALAIRA